MRKLKKAQEEMVGFVLIIILVSIIALVFLGISLRKKKVIQNSLEIGDFLQALGKITTRCEINQGLGYVDIRDLIKSCLDNKVCLDNNLSCDILDKELVEIINKSWKICDNCARTGYIFTINYKNITEYELKKGNCNGTITGGWTSINYMGDNIIINLKICSKAG